MNGSQTRAKACFFLNLKTDLNNSFLAKGAGIVRGRSASTPLHNWSRQIGKIMKFSTLLKLIRFWPPFLGSGIRVHYFSDDFKIIEVKMVLRFWNKNYVGTQFGGSLYSMTDPFYMLMLVYLLGREYIVWDKSAIIRYKKPAKSTVYARFEISQELLDSIKEALQYKDKVEPEFLIKVRNEAGEVVTEISKNLHISKKQRSKTKSHI